MAMYKYLKRCESAGWIDVARNARLRGYIKRGVTVKERYVGKYGVGVRIKTHIDSTYYSEIVRTVQKPDVYFTAVFRKKSDVGDVYKYKEFTVLNIIKRNDGYHCNLADGITAILKPDWELYKSDVWEVLGV